MKRLRLLVTAVLYCSLSSFLSNAQGKIDSSQVRTLRIDPQSARGAAVSQVFDEVKFIPLETTNESLFGSVQELKIVNEHFIIFDWDTKSVLIFKPDGKYRNKINASRIQKDKADDSKSEFYGFTNTVENGEHLIQIRTGKNTYFFNFDGKQIKKVSYKEAPYKFDYNFANKTTKVRPNFIHRYGKDSTTYEFGIFNGKDSVGYFPYNAKRYDDDEFWGGRHHFYETTTPNEMLFFDYYNYDLFKITPTQTTFAYHIILPISNSLPEDFKSNPSYKNKRGEYFKNNSKIYYGLSHTFLMGDNLYLKLMNFGWEPELKKSIIYNLKSGELTSIQDLEPDSLSSFLPVTDATGGFYDFKNNGFLLYQNDYLYTSYSSLAMFTFKDQLSDKFDKFSPEMAQYFKTQNKKSNPIIVQLKPKKN